jgi:hypothetical protein
MKLFYINIFLLLTSLTSFAQKNKWLESIMKNADTVLVVSHEETAGVAIIDTNGKETALPKLIIDGKPNFAIIKEQELISGAKLDTLVKILERPFADRQIQMSNCFIPHHAIFILKKGKTSFVEICFGCRGIETSADLKKLYYFDNRKWSELENFFKNLGFTYKLTED